MLSRVNALLLPLILAASGVGIGLAIPTAVNAASFDINDGGDAPDFNPGDGVCETALGNGICTLRAAIQETNALGGLDTVGIIVSAFNTFPLTNLDPITDDLTSDVSSAGDCGHVIVGDFPSAGITIQGDSTLDAGLTVNAPGKSVTLIGYGIKDFNRISPSTGVGLEILAGEVTLKCANIFNNALGVRLQSTENALIGGLVTGEGNWIHDNPVDGIFCSGIGSILLSVWGNVIDGNEDGIYLAGCHGAFIGYQADSNGRNAIGNNTHEGIHLSSSDDTVIRNNYVGVLYDGVTQNENDQSGIKIEGTSARTIIGGPNSGYRNVVSGNIDSGIVIPSGASDTEVSWNYIGVDITTTNLCNGYPQVNDAAPDTTYADNTYCLPLPGCGNVNPDVFGAACFDGNLFPPDGQMSEASYLAAAAFFDVTPGPYNPSALCTPGPYGGTCPDAVTETPTVTSTPTATVTVTRTFTSTPAASSTVTNTATVTRTPTITPTSIATPTVTATVPCSNMILPDPPQNMDPVSRNYLNEVIRRLRLIRYVPCQ